MNLQMAEWHDGVDKMHKLMNVPDHGDPTKPGLSAHAQRLLHLSSLLAIGTVDDEGRPWTTLLGGEQGFARSLGQSIVGLKALADASHDPVLRALLAQPRVSTPGEYETAREFSALGIHLASRDRVKVQGRLLGGSRVGNESSPNDSQDGATEVQMALAIEGSLGNCPKYLNKKDIVLAVPQPVPLPDTLPLSQPALDLLAKADTIFITSHHPSHMSTNHRGGPPGFIRVECNDSQSVILAYPEYSGNRLYQTLGNLILDPRAGIVVPDFDTGNVLYISGTTKIIAGKNASRLLPRSNLAVQIRVDAAKFVHKGLGFRGLPGEPSPYNPPVRYLTTERPATNPDNDTTTSTATLLSRTILTPTIAHFRFRLSEPANHGWTAGQYVALSFEDELSGGYAHSNDDDPRSLNDDYVRTFTISSPPPPSCASRHQQAGMTGGHELAKDGSRPPVPNDEFEITIRNVGTVTRFLFNANIRAGLAIPLRGFGGSFAVKQQDGAKEIVTPFVAGGIGITPLLAQLPSLDLSRLLVLWTVNSRDVGLVMDTMRRHPGLGAKMRVFVSGDPVRKPSGPGEIDGEAVEGVFERRRMVREDVVGIQDKVDDTWYICAGTGLRTQLLEWLEGKTVVYEDFDY